MVFIQNAHANRTRKWNNHMNPNVFCIHFLFENCYQSLFKISCDLSQQLCDNSGITSTTITAAAAAVAAHKNIIHLPLLFIWFKDYRNGKYLYILQRVIFFCNCNIRNESNMLSIEWVCEWKGMGGNNFMPAMLNTAATVLNKTQCIPIWKVVWIVNPFVCFFGWCCCCCCCFFREMLESYEKSVKSTLSKSVYLWSQDTAVTLNGMYHFWGWIAYENIHVLPFISIAFSTLNFKKI